MARQYHGSRLHFQGLPAGCFIRGIASPSVGIIPNDKLISAERTIRLRRMIY
jgi:hypothetical protein